MPKKIDMLGVQIDNLSMEEATARILSFLKSDEKRMIFTPNPEFILFAEKDPLFKEILNKGDLVVADGIGLVYGANILKTPLKERVPGIELIENMMALLPSDKSVFMLGAKPGVAAKAASNMKKKYPTLHIAGTYHGYFEDHEKNDIIKMINKASPDILLVGLGPPRQEKWIYENMNFIDARLFFGVGGSFDVLSGKLERAPDIFISLHLEWFYRLLKEPKRIKRQIFIPVYLYKVFKERIRQKKYTNL